MSKEDWERRFNRPVVDEYNNSAYEKPVNEVNPNNKPAGDPDADENWEDNVEAEAYTPSEE